MLEYFILFVHRNDQFMTVGIAARLIVVILLHRRGELHSWPQDRSSVAEFSK